MSKNDTKEEPSEEVEAVGVKEKPKCFVIMPISDKDPYPTGHFRRVYSEIIIPAVEAAGYEPRRADDSNQSHLILLDILKSIVNYDMAICDVSGFNPNVLYELGIRQMARKPVVLIQDNDERLFDISGINALRYDNSLRVDLVREAVGKITDALNNTKDNYENKAGSLIDLLGIDVQIKKTEVKVTEGENMILARLDKLERQNSLKLANFNSEPEVPPVAREVRKTSTLSRLVVRDTSGTVLNIGDVIINAPLQSDNKRPAKSLIYVILDIKPGETGIVTAIDISSKNNIQFNSAYGYLTGFSKIEESDIYKILDATELSLIKEIRTHI